MAENNDNNSELNESPKMKIDYHQDGSIKEFTFILPRQTSSTSLQQHANGLRLPNNRIRLDSGYEEEDSPSSKIKTPLVQTGMRCWTLSRKICNFE